MRKVTVLVVAFLLSASLASGRSLNFIEQGRATWDYDYQFAYSSGMTIVAWFRVPSSAPQNGYQLVVALNACNYPYSDKANNLGLGIYWSGSKWVAKVHSAGQTPGNGTTTITQNVWHHAAIVWDGTDWNYYLDGVFEYAVTPSGSNWQSHKGLCIGHHSNAQLTVDSWYGQVAQVAIYPNRQLTTGELSTLRYCTPDSVPGAEVYYPAWSSLRSDPNEVEELMRAAHGDAEGNNPPTVSADGPPIAVCMGGQ